MGLFRNLLEDTVITLTLVHLLQPSPVQSWTFDDESVIKVGRSNDNHVILYSAVVSRHHLKLQRFGINWRIISLGGNGTYWDGKRISETTVVDGMILRLATSGPQIKIHTGTAAFHNAPTARFKSRC